MIRSARLFFVGLLLKVTWQVEGGGDKPEDNQVCRQRPAAVLVGLNRQKFRPSSTQFGLPPKVGLYNISGLLWPDPFVMRDVDSAFLEFWGRQIGRNDRLRVHAYVRSEVQACEADAGTDGSRQ
jgi:hypothetical protein